MPSAHSDEYDESDLAALSTAYAVAIRLESAGESHDEIACALGIGPSEVAGVLTLAHRKLDEIRRRDSDTMSGRTDTPLRLGGG